MRLTVQSADKDDVLRDIARLHLSHRPDIRAGRILKLSANGQSVFLAARGALGYKTGCLWLDSESRRRLRVKPAKEYEFTIKKAGLVGEFR